MKKYLSAALLITTILLLPLMLHAQTDDAYITVRCTVTVSVDVLDAYDRVGSTTVAFSPGEVWISTYVQVQNNSDGALTSWQLQISTQEYSTDGITWTAATDLEAWTISTDGTPGIDEVVIQGIFKNATSADAADFTDNADEILDQTNKLYDVGGAYDSNTAAYADAYPDGGANDVDVNETRNLFFRIKFPTAVANEYFHRFTVRVTASLP